jgi:hypothetical protein
LPSPERKGQEERETERACSRLLKSRGADEGRQSTGRSKPANGGRQRRGRFFSRTASCVNQALNVCTARGANPNAGQSEGWASPERTRKPDRRETRPDNALANRADAGFEVKIFRSKKRRDGAGERAADPREGCPFFLAGSIAFPAAACRTPRWAFLFRACA